MQSVIASKEDPRNRKVASNEIRQDESAIDTSVGIQSSDTAVDIL